MFFSPCVDTFVAETMLAGFNCNLDGPVEANEAHVQVFNVRFLLLFNYLRNFGLVCLVVLGGVFTCFDFNYFTVIFGG